MNITLSIDERVVDEARRVAQSLGKSLNQMIRDYLDRVTQKPDLESRMRELRRLSKKGGGDSKGWKFNRDEIYDRHA